MEIRPLSRDEAALRRFVEELWLPYHRELAATVDGHALADDGAVDVVAEEVEFRRERLGTDGYRAWVAVDEGDRGDDEPAADGEGTLAGFVTTEVSEAPPVFDWPDRLHVGDVYVEEPYRGSGLAQALMDRATERARAAGCREVTLDVDVQNERALAFYEKLGFEPRRFRMTAPVDEQ